MARMAWRKAYLNYPQIQQRVVQFMEESGPPEPFKGSNATEELKRKTFGTLFKKEAKKGHGGGGEANQIAGKSVKKQWGFGGFKMLVTMHNTQEGGELSV
ncbi:hypothetical protein PIB30_111791 [Stylosanthes scabra]|uniref:Uncharacterized protein n=1 Tax=Stylosanthes scabra TaxID=79078 RepID=A0ABU6W2B6_9FABA|nr:hypothetical protein [Stylosanthes scabra]